MPRLSFTLRDVFRLTLVVASALTIATVASYSAGYILLSKERIIGATKIRVFPNELLARAYYPAKVVERSIIRQKVLLSSR